MKRLIPMSVGLAVLTGLFGLIDGLEFPNGLILSLCLFNFTILAYLLEQIEE